jgi:hypothetical protein
MMRYKPLKTKKKAHSKTSIFILMSLFIIFIFIFSFSFLALAAKDSDRCWSYSVENGIEKSKRTYLLVHHDPDTKQQKTITVTSQCERPYLSERTYGTCKHNIGIQPAGTKFNINTGEDVVRVEFTWEAPLILATIEYGCCAGPDTVRFYTDKGKYLGAIRGDSVDSRANFQNLIVRTFDMGNGTRYGKKIYLLLEKDRSESGLEAWVYENANKTRKIPVLLTIPEGTTCEDWYVSEFVAYGDRHDIILKLKGVWCSNNEGIKDFSFSCLPTDREINCQPVQLKQEKGAGDKVIGDGQKNRNQKR